MPMPTDVGIIDTMIGFPAKDFEHYEFIRKQLKEESAEYDFPVEYMFKGVPKEKYGADDPVALTLGEMDAHGIEYGLIGCEGEVNRKALADHPDRFVATCQADANDVMGAVRRIRRYHDTYDIRAVGTFPAGCFPQIPIDDAKWYPVYAACCELDIAVFVCAGVPGPRLPMDCQHVERLDRVMYDFPELTLVTRHGCEPWEDHGREADAQVAGSALLHVGLRAQALPLRDHRLRQHPGCRQDHLRRLLPHGPVASADHGRDAQRRLPRRGVAQVPAGERSPSPQDQLARPCGEACRMVTFDDVRRLGLRLPEVTESTWYGTPGLKVRNKGFCRLWGEREHRRDRVHDTEVLVLFCELEMKPVLLENHPDMLFTVPHYDGYGAVLVRLADADIDDLDDWLEDSYRRVAPATLIRLLDDR